jgi:hypothetical protein
MIMPVSLVPLSWGVVESGVPPSNCDTGVRLLVLPQAMNAEETAMDMKRKDQTRIRENL